MIPIRTDYKMTQRPWVNYGLLAVNIALYFAGYNGVTQSGLHKINHLLLQSNAPELYQFISSVFLHASFMHLAGNMMFLWVFGNAINDKFGHVGYLAFYLAGGILAGVGYILLSGHAPVLGASGAIAAVTGAYLVLLPRSRVTVLALLFYVMMPFEISSLYFLAFQVIFNFVMTAGDGGGVAYAAHSSGYVFGIAVAAGLLALRLLPRDTYDLLNLIKSHQRRSRYKRMVGQGYDPFSYVNPELRRKAGNKWVDARNVAQEAPDSPAGKEMKLRSEISQALLRHDLSGAAAKYLQLVQVVDSPVLSQPQQLDVANHLMSSEQHAAAADAYERFLKHYSSYEYTADICLMLGLLYGRYLHQYDRAEECLTKAIESLDDPQKLQLATSELEAVRRSRS